MDITEKTHGKRMKWLCWLSSLLFLCGLFIVFSSIIVSQDAGWSFGDQITPPEFKYTKNIGLAVLWVCAILCFLIAILGCILRKIERHCLIMMYGSGLGCVSMVVFIIGIVFAFQATFLPNAINQVCRPKNTPQFQPFMKATYLDTNMLYHNTYWMCTKTCPCDSAIFNNGYAAISEADLNYYGRTKVNGTPNKIPIYTVAQGGMTSFEQCWNTTIINKNITNSQINGPAVKKAMAAYLPVMRQLEPAYKCSGSCIPGLYWFTLPISTQPKTGCIGDVTTSLAQAYVFPGWACIIAAILMFLIFLFQYTLWCDKSNKAKTEQKQDDQSEDRD